MNNYNPSFDFTPEALTLVGEARLAYVRKVYSYFGLGILAAIGGALFSMQTPLVMIVHQNPLLGFAASIMMVIFASKSSTHPRYAVPTLIGYAFVVGVVLSPTLFMISNRYIPGVGPEVIYDALGLTGMIFAGLTSYVWVTKKDFSYMGASLMIGLFLIIGVSVLNIFIASSAVSLAVAVVSVVAFSGFVLYYTSLILRDAMSIPPTLAALNLFLAFVNLFMAILRILISLNGGNRSRR